MIFALWPFVEGRYLCYEFAGSNEVHTPMYIAQLTKTQFLRYRLASQNSGSREITFLSKRNPFEYHHNSVTDSKNEMPFS